MPPRPALDPARLAFVDESGATTTLVRAHARPPRGERACGTAPGGHSDKLIAFAAFTLAGLEAAM